jgi:hypothetical protein
MVEPVLELIGGNLNTPLMPLNKDRVGTVEKDLIVEIEWYDEEYLSVEIVSINENHTP